MPPSHYIRTLFHYLHSSAIGNTEQALLTWKHLSLSEVHCIVAQLHLPSFSNEVFCGQWKQIDWFMEETAMSLTSSMCSLGNWMNHIGVYRFQLQGHEYRFL